MRKPAPNELYCLNGVDPFAGRANRHHLAREKEVGVGLVLGAADPAAQLIEIGQPEAIGPIDDDGVGVRNIEAALDDRGADEDVDFPGDEALHDGFEFIRIHLAVAKSRPARPGQSSAIRSRTLWIDRTRLCRK